MTCVTYASSKGGVGKTTTCVATAWQFARRGYDTAILELDRNAPIANLMETQQEPNITFVEAPPAHERLPQTFKRLQRHHDVLLVDLPGAASTEMLTATGSSDLVVVPMQTNWWDAREAAATYNEITQLTEDMISPPSVRILLTRTPASPIVPRYYHQTIAEVDEAEIPRFRAEMVERKEWREIQRGGKYPSKEKAAYENAESLFEEILELLSNE